MLGNLGKRNFPSSQPVIKRLLYTIPLLVRKPLEWHWNSTRKSWAARETPDPCGSNRVRRCLRVTVTTQHTPWQWLECFFCLWESCLLSFQILIRFLQRFAQGFSSSSEVSRWPALMAFIGFYQSSIFQCYSFRFCYFCAQKSMNALLILPLTTFTFS